MPRLLYQSRLEGAPTEADWIGTGTAWDWLDRHEIANRTGWRDEKSAETARFRRLYGDAHWQAVVAWFERAELELGTAGGSRPV